MKLGESSRSLKSAFTLLSMLQACIMMPALAQGPSSGDNAPRLKVTMKLASGASLTQGEPIILRYEVTNPVAVSLVGLTKKDGSNWLSEQLIGQDGSEVPHAPQFDPDKFATGIQTPINEMSIPGYGTETDDIVVNREFSVPAPGNYTLVVKVNLPYAPQANTAPPLSSNHGAIIETFSFPLTIDAPDLITLQRDAQSLIDAILKNPSPGVNRERINEIQELMSMPESVAAPYWQQLAERHIDVSQELYRVHTAVAADILAFMISQATSSAEADTYLRWLDKIHETGSDTLKQHIDNLTSQLRLPKIRYEPILTD